MDLRSFGAGARVVFGLGALTLLAGAGPVRFEGCGCDGGPPEEGTPLPRADAGSCTSDEDCPASACADVRCLAGTCLEVGPQLDRDADGASPPPCGDDCDDEDATRTPGAMERCDGRDNDCDDAIDEGAPRRDTVYQLMDGEPRSVVLPWGRGFLVTVRTAGALWGIPVAFDGTAGAPLELTRLTMGTSFVDVAARAAPDGRILLVTQTDLDAMRYLVFSRRDDGSVRIHEGPASLAGPADVTDIRLIAHDGGWALGYEAPGETAEAPSRRLVAFDPMAEPTVELPLDESPAPFDLASDGVRVALTGGVDEIVFFEADGTEAGRHTLPGPLPVGALASWDGSVVATFPDDFDFNLVHVEAGAGPLTPRPAPFSEGDDEPRLDAAGGLVLVARIGGGKASMQAVEGDLTMLASTELRFGSDRTTIEQVSFAESEGAIAGLGSQNAGASLGILRACAD